MSTDSASVNTMDSSSQLLSLMRDFVSNTEKNLIEENNQLKADIDSLRAKLKYYEHQKQPYFDSYSELIKYIDEIPESDLDVTCAEYKNMEFMLTSTNAKPIEITRLALLYMKSNLLRDDWINVFRPDARTQFRSFIGNRFCINYIIMWKVFYGK